MKQKLLLILALLCAVAQGAWAQRVVDLSTCSSDYVAQDGDVLTGMLGADVMISIADNATVTLNTVTIFGTNDKNCNWAGITCLGNATIILEGNNTIRGFYEDNPGIYVPGNRDNPILNNSLIIKGTGSLNVSSNGMAAGIGGGYYIHSGNITIEGITIRATGGNRSAAIGGGWGGNCGNINIDASVSIMSAVKGENAPYTIGGGSGAKCGTVTVGGVEGGISQSPYSNASYRVVMKAGTSDAKNWTFSPSGNVVKGTKVDIAYAGNRHVKRLKARMMPEVLLVSGIRLNKSKMIITEGQTETLSITALIPNEAPDKSVTWSSSNTNAATVEASTGVVTAVAVGVATITATANDGGGAKASCEVTVTRDLSNVDLATVYSDITMPDGSVLRGKLGADAKISIADGATVTLRDVTISGTNSEACPWAGITCEGDAKLILEGTNSIKGFLSDYPGIYVAPSKKLIIKGTGLLDASSNGNAAAIGGGSHISCGDITISGGTITATGGSNAAAIGGGNRASCGNISITNEVTSVTATKGSDSANTIGAGFSGSCGKVTVGGVEGVINDNPYTFVPQKVSNLSTITADYVAQDGEILTGTLGANVKISIAAGATVTLSGITINGVQDEKYPWAGITCEGDATLIIEGENSVRGFFTGYPGIQAGPAGTLLTIKGPGSIFATSNEYSSGIGSAMKGECGDITICGGTVKAKGSGFSAAIGGGWNGSCGVVTITNDVIRVEAEKGAGGVYTFGSGGKVIIGSDEGWEEGIGHIKESPYIYVPLDNLTADYRAQHGEVLGGTLKKNVKVSIVDKATVILKGVTIEGVDSEDCPWAGITCEGNATINIAERTPTTIKGFHHDYPGIQAGPEGTMLVIGSSGYAELYCSSNGNGAGIGGGHQVSCGDIWVYFGSLKEIGIVQATGGYGAAGIGGGSDASCGNITIYYGIVKADGGFGAPGIGSGMVGSCGNLSFQTESSLLGLYVTKGNGSPYCIGPGLGGTCGTVEGLSGYVTESPFIIRHY